MLGKIKGWNFKRAFSADGSTTLDTLNADKKRLEARRSEIPGIIAELTESTRRATQDIAWLKSLSNHKQKKWEKEKGTTVEAYIYKVEKGIISNDAGVSTLTTELEQIPSTLKAIQSQMDTLIKGESVGLEKGLDAESAKALGEIELRKEKERMAHERAIREAEFKAESQKRELQAQKDRQAMEVQAKAAEQQKSGTNQNKLFIGIGIVLLLVVGGFILYKRKMAKAITP